MKNPFWNREQGRPRTLWRLLILVTLFVIGNLLIAFAIGLLGALLFLLRPSGPLSNIAARISAAVTQPGFSAVAAAGTLLIVLGSVWFTGRFVDRRRFRDFGFHFSPNWWLDLGFGLALGAVLMAGIFLVELASGWITVTGALMPGVPGESFLLTIVLALIAFICVGIYEELLSRGYPLRNLAEGFNWPGLGPRGAVLVAWGITSVAFGLLHALNPNATAVSTANLILAGLFLGLGYILTGELAIPIGLHITWNFFQGNVFGFPVSGTNAGATFIAIFQSGPELWTGGAFGPEAGLIGIAALLVGSGLILLWVRLRRGRADLATRLAEYQRRDV